MANHRRENRRLWDEWSDTFQSYWNANTAEGELPPAPSPFDTDRAGGTDPDPLDSIAGAEYVELGCGGGQGSVGTARLGADAVVGVDFSREQLRHARRLRDFYGVDARFVQGDVTDLPLPDDAFDLASSEAAFQMIPDIDRALAEARRVLRDGGVFVLSLPHPLYEALDAESRTLEGDYLDTGPREVTVDDGYESTLVLFDRTVARVYNALRDAGFEVNRMLEHVTDPVAGSDPDESDRPDVLWEVPRSVRFRAVAR
ncbi:class I SAM-dependent methyltransferase [Halobaculum roseum]|uniref:Class I SAM-dependent methyltransferase n=1 Tax=Halobaculum roseum TaxID=2175149 RepID=A0ABD5MLV6_9EURY|nr:class I SAM-dependent methyltransferase [Halobaculum roseum]QZY03833.1 methyltransferase domain-containing protein [Halobaculum roseum]